MIRRPEENETGFLMSAGDADGLADAIEKVIVDLSLARRLGENSYGRTVKLFSIEKNVRTLLATITNRECN
jgi:glycosyltransferase involved in cell wall biosynthesis